VSVRALVTVHPAPSHLRSVVPVARAIRCAGHDVVVATPATLHAEVRAYGLEPVCAGGHWSEEEVAGVDRVLGGLGQPWRWGHLFLSTLTDPSRMARDVVALAPAWGPDVIVHDGTELGGAWAAEVLGLPYVTLGTMGGSRSLLGLGAPEDRMLVRPLAREDSVRWRPGPPPPRLNVSLLPPVYDPAETAAPDVRCYRPESPLRGDERMPDWVAELPDDRPLVYASLGTVFHRIPGRLEAIVSGLAEVNCSVVVSIGPDTPHDRFPTQPAHVRLAAHVPQPLLLECCDLFVTHGGMNSVREALSAGVPMVVAPVVMDHPYNAARCEALGVARALPEGDVSPAALAAACREVLGDDGFRRRARAVQRAILALPPLDQLVRDVEALVAGR
jgi:UDP:flavonoid glycosyltransferase YjiC (YdhE family)